MTRSGHVLRLLGAELVRLRSRRVALFAALVVLAAIGLFQLAVNDQVRPPSASEVTEQRQFYEQAHRQWQQSHEAEEKACQDQGGSQADCVLPEPTPADFSLTASSFADVAPTAVQLSAYATLLAAFLVGASFIGAEYTTGSLANWLTFVPQRLRVYGSKLLAVVLVVAVGGAVSNFVMVGLVALLTRAHGGALTGLAGVAATAGRAIPIAVLAGVAGFVLALVTRHTVAALGIALGYVVVAAVLSGIASDAAGPLAWLAPWVPGEKRA